MSSFLKVLMLGVEMELGNSFSVLHPLMLVLEFQQLFCDRGRLCKIITILSEEVAWLETP